jgi:hypothetical protein
MEHPAAGGQDLVCVLTFAWQGPALGCAVTLPLSAAAGARAGCHWHSMCSPLLAVCRSRCALNAAAALPFMYTSRTALPSLVAVTDCIAARVSYRVVGFCRASCSQLPWLAMH